MTLWFNKSSVCGDLNSMLGHLNFFANQTVKKNKYFMQITKKRNKQQQKS